MDKIDISYLWDKSLYYTGASHSIRHSSCYETRRVIIDIIGDVNKTFVELLGIYLDIYKSDIGVYRPTGFKDIKNIVKEIKTVIYNDPFTMSGVEEYNITTGEKVVLLSNDKYLHLYKESEEFGIRLFIKYFNDSFNIIPSVMGDQYKGITREELIDKLS